MSRGCAISSSRGHPQDFLGWGQIQGCKKSWRIILVVTLKTQVFTVTTNAQNTFTYLQHSQMSSALKTFHFLRRGRGRLCSSKWSPMPWHNAQWPVQACPHDGTRFTVHCSLTVFCITHMHNFAVFSCPRDAIGRTTNSTNDACLEYWRQLVS